MGCSKSSCKREVYSNSISPEEIVKITSKQSKLTTKATIERRTKKTQNQKRKKRFKIREEILKKKRSEENGKHQ